MSRGSSGCLSRGCRLIVCQLICVCSVLAAQERLIGGGAAVASAKSGLFGKIGLLLAKGGKGIVVGLLVIGAAIWSFIKRLAFGREESPTRQL